MKITTSAFIELHINSEQLLLNVNLIESIRSSSGRAQVYMAGSSSDEYWIVDESYDQVIEKIYEI